MKYKAILLAALSLACATFSHAEDAPYTSDIVFRGVLDMGDTVNFSLSTPGGQKSSWSEIGGSFQGYEIVRYDRENRTLFVSKDGQEYMLGMAGMQATQAEQNLKEAKEQAAKLFKQIRFEETISKIMDSQMDAMAQSMRQQMAAQGNADEEYLAFQEKVVKEMFKEMDWKSMQTGMEQAYAEVFTVAELQGMNEFYSTPAGQASIDKAPELQAKTMKILMPEIMKASESMQKKIQDYHSQKKDAD